MSRHGSEPFGPSPCWGPARKGNLADPWLRSFLKPSSPPVERGWQAAHCSCAPSRDLELSALSASGVRADASPWGDEPLRGPWGREETGPPTRRPKRDRSGERVCGQEPLHTPPHSRGGWTRPGRCRRGTMGAGKARVGLEGGGQGEQRRGVAQWGLGSPAPHRTVWAGAGNRDGGGGEDTVTGTCASAPPPAPYDGSTPQPAGREGGVTARRASCPAGQQVRCESGGHWVGQGAELQVTWHHLGAPTLPPCAPVPSALRQGQMPPSPGWVRLCGGTSVRGGVMGQGPGPRLPDPSPEGFCSPVPW